jgi:polyhydroxyalkanoate synthesis repressor PhaR
MRVIKRYPNRKLYDTETKQYVTLDQLADLIRGDEELKVYDNVNGDDLTALVLTQVLFEQVKKQAGFLPRTVLAGLIQAGGSRFSGLQRRLAGPLGFSHFVDEEIRRRVGELLKQEKLTLEESNHITELLTSVEMVENEEPIPDEQVIEQALEERGMATRSQVQQLLDQIEALSARLDSIETSKEETSE